MSDAQHLSPPTARATRHRLNLMESWFERHRYDFTLGRQAQLDAILDVAVTDADAADLDRFLRAWREEARRTARAITAAADVAQAERLAALDDATPTNLDFRT